MKNIIKYLIISAFATVFYIASIDYEAVKCDDTGLIDYYTKYGNTTGSVLGEFSQSYLNTTYYRPLVNISFRIDAALWGKDAGKYHRLNILLHIAFCLLLFTAVKRLSDSETLALLAALIYAVHPLFANAVAWIPGRNDLMLGVFGMASFIYFDNYLQTKKLKDLLLNSVFFLLALFSKETAIILPVLFFTFAYLQDSKTALAKNKINMYITWFAGGILWFALRSMAEKGKDVNVFGFDIFISNLRVLPEFLGKFFVPVNLSVLPTYSGINSMIGIVIILALISLAYFTAKSDKKMALWGLLWFALLVLPTTIFQRGNADEWNDYLYCRSYLPLAGIIFMLSVFLKNRVKDLKPNLLLGIGMIPVLIAGAINYQHSDAYSSPVTFYENAIEQDSSRAYYYQIIGNYYSAKGDFSTAESYFQTAASNQSGYYKRYFQLGEVAMVQKEYSKAITHYKKALELAPNDKAVLFALSQAYVSAVQIDSAKSIWGEMIKLYPDSPEAYFELFNISIFNLDYDNIDLYGKKIIAHGFQNQLVSERLNSIAQNAFKSKALEEGIYFWNYAYALDNSNTSLLKYLAGSYYVLANKDSTGKYLNLFKERRGNLSQAEEEMYSTFLK